jgi:CheY-like chemotaxis protein
MARLEALFFSPPAFWRRIMSTHALVDSLSPSPIGGFHILFVDDSPDERELFPVRLGAFGARLATVESADEALAVLERGETDVLVTDLTLPDCDGYGLLRRVREMPPERGGAVPVIVATGWSGPQEREAALGAGFAGYLAKPYETQALVSVIAGLTRSIERLRAIRARCREQRRGQAEVRAWLAERRVLRGERRAGRALERGGAEATEEAKRILVLGAARRFAEICFSRPAEELDVTAVTPLDARSESWVVRAACARDALLVEVVLGPGAALRTRGITPGR